MGREYQREGLTLGSLALFGDLLFADDFEGTTLLWTGTGDGADFVCAIATAAAYMRTSGLHLATRTTAPATGDVVRATVRLPQTLAKQVTLLAHFKNISDSLVKYVTFGFTGARDDYAFNLGVRYDPALAKWQRQAPGAAFVDVTGGGFDGNPNAWHRMLLVWDWALEEYVKLVIDEDVIDMSGFAFDVTANGGDLELQAYIEVEAATDAIATAHFDNYAILQGDKVRLGASAP